MPAQRTVLEHLADGREALVQEMRRLAAALAELDAVIGRLGTGSRLGPPPPTRSGDADTDADKAAPVATVRRGAARKAPRRSASRPADRGRAGGKSIRVHVLDMLAAEDREFGLSEIIDRIHREGVPAHDDAVRSITTKLMKDGKVERIGRGQYRLARAEVATGATGPAVAPEPDDASGADSSRGTPPPDEPLARPTPPLNLSQPWDSSAI
jgi:hypothetical protein